MRPAEKPVYQPETSRQPLRVQRAKPMATFTVMAAWDRSHARLRVRGGAHFDLAHLYPAIGVYPAIGGGGKSSQGRCGDNVSAGHDESRQHLALLVHTPSSSGL